jgi:hypothetical protein
MLSAAITVALSVVAAVAYFINDLIQQRRELDGLVSCFLTAASMAALYQTLEMFTTKSTYHINCWQKFKTHTKDNIATATNEKQMFWPSSYCG